MTKITPLSLYIINEVRLRRMVLGIAAKKLSKLLGHSPSYVVNMESNLSYNTYPPHEWPKLAEALSCSVEDLLPSKRSTSTGELIEKKIPSLNEEAYVVIVVTALKEYGYFIEKRTLEDVVKRFEIQDKDQVQLLKKVLTDQGLITTENE